MLANHVTIIYEICKCVENGQCSLNGSVGIDLKELGGSDVQMFEILPRD